MFGGRRPPWVLALPIAVIVSIFAAALAVGLQAFGQASRDAGVENIAARQTMLIERYAGEVHLALAGSAMAEPEAVADELLTNAAALLEGGTVEGLQGSGHTEIEIDAVTEAALRRKFAQSLVVDERLIAAGERLIAGLDSDPAALEQFRTDAALAASTAKDAAGSLTNATVDRADTASNQQLALAGAGLIATIAAAAVIWRQATRSRDRRYRSLIHNSSDLVLIVDRDSRVAFASDAVRRLLGTVAAPNAALLLDLVDPADSASLANVLQSVTRSASAPVQFRVRHVDGRSMVLAGTVSDRSHVLEIRGLVVNLHDVTDRIRLEDELTRKAFEDSLTGLANRALLIDRIDHALRRTARSDESIAVLFIDLDDFKQINDSSGHIVGDQVLRAVAERLQTCVREGDTLARVGGDEFAVLAEGLHDGNEALELGRRVVAACNERLAVGDRKLIANASVGVAVAGDRTSTTDLLRDADVAMYAAKTQGRGRCVMFEPQMLSDAVATKLMSVALAEAIDGDLITVVYQPIVDARTRSIMAVEALARWNSPVFGQVPPDQFVAVAEQFGLIDRLGAAVLRIACSEATLWADGPAGPINVSVNVSALQLQDAGFTEVVKTVLEATGLPAARLTLELTETAFASVATIVPVASSLRSLGVRLAIDDFGTGYSTLEKLADLPVDELKIDKAFIDRLSEHSGQGMIRGIVEMVKHLGLSTTAEGVETLDQEALINAFGLDLAQGYLYSRPVDADTVRALLSRDVIAVEGITDAN